MPSALFTSGMHIRLTFYNHRRRNMKNLPFSNAAREPDKDLASLNFVQLYNMNEPEYFLLLFRVVVAVYMNSIY